MMMNANVQRFERLALPQGRPLGYPGVVNGVLTSDVVVPAPVPASEARKVPPAVLLKPMPTIIPAKPGQVTSGQMGLGCHLSALANDNPLLAVGLAVGLGLLIRGMR